MNPLILAVGLGLMAAIVDKLLTKEKSDGKNDSDSGSGSGTGEQGRATGKHDRDRIIINNIFPKEKHEKQEKEVKENGSTGIDSSEEHTD